MLPTYRATLRGDRLEWEDDAPIELGADTPVSVYVTVIDSPGIADEDRGRRMAEVLETLANAGGIGSIADPVQWQRDEREDRDIPGRS